MRQKSLYFYIKHDYKQTYLLKVLNVFQLHVIQKWVAAVITAFQQSRQCNYWKQTFQAVELFSGLVNDKLSLKNV